MENPALPLPLAGEDSPVFSRTSSGVWSLEDDRLASIAEFDDGPVVVLVRCEHVLVLTVALPPMPSAARRRAALPFAVEERIADPLEEVHVALGAQVAPGVWLAGVVRHDLMRRWVMRLEDAGIERASIVPDALSLPVPGSDSWSVDLAGERAMVRASDGTGFALPLPLLTPAWKAAGEPACIAYGDSLPPPMQAARTALEAEPLANRLMLPALDLRQGSYALPPRRIDPLWKRVAGVAALGALAHAFILVADTLALYDIASDREAEVRAMAASVQPSLVLGPDIGSALADMAPDGATGGPSQFLSLLVRTGAALGGLPRPVSWRSISFDRTAATLNIEVEADDIGGLQQVADGLTRSGLSAQQGAASIDLGRAVGSFAIRAS